MDNLVLFFLYFQLGLLVVTSAISIFVYYLCDQPLGFQNRPQLITQHVSYLLIVLYQLLDFGHLISLFNRRKVIYYGYSFICLSFKSYQFYICETQQSRDYAFNIVQIFLFSCLTRSYHVLFAEQYFNRHLLFIYDILKVINWKSTGGVLMC